jgi:hypothetical protein
MMVSAVRPCGELRFRIHEGSFRAADFAEFCKQLMHDVEGEIFLIVDRGPVHTAKETKEFTEKTQGNFAFSSFPRTRPS